MVETLYKTNKPEAGVSEYYELVIQTRPRGAHPLPGPDSYTFKEIHAWWDESQTRFIHTVTTIGPEDGMSFAEAEEMYWAARRHRADNGFIHAFRPDYSGNGRFEYEHIVEDRKFERGDHVEMLIDSGPFRAGSVLRVTGIRTLREQGALDPNEVYVVGDDAAGWIPEESVGHPADPLR